MGRTRKMSRQEKAAEEEERQRRAKAKKSPSELEQELEEVFKQFDEDDSGTVSVSELRHMLQLLGQNPTEREVTAMVNQFDDNKNGQLDFDEFKQLITDHLKDEEAREDELRNAFAVFDKDDSGLIDKKELARVLRSTGEKLSREEIDQVFNAIDTNGDGQINYEEFAAAMQGGGLFNCDEEQEGG